jgi:single-strand DNA-binding protein
MESIMALNLNQVTLAGHLTRDPELKQLAPDRVVANTAIAINRRWKNQAGEVQEEATFIDLEAWGRTAELMGQFLKKGSPAFVQGRLKLDQWETPEGDKRSRVRVVVDQVHFLHAAQREDDGEAAEASAPGAGARPGPARRPAVRPAPLAKTAAAATSADDAPF